MTGPSTQPTAHPTAPTTTPPATPTTTPPATQTTTPPFIQTTTQPTARPGTQTDAVIEGVRAMIRDGRLVAGARLPVEKDLAASLAVSRGSLREGVRALVALGILETRQGDGTYVTSLEPHRVLGSVNVLADLPASAHDVHLAAVRRALEVEAVGLAAARASEAQLERMAQVLTEVEAVLARDSSPPEGDGGVDGDGDGDGIAERRVEAAVAADSEFHRLVAEASGNAPLAALIDHLVGQTFRARVWRGLNEAGATGLAHAEHRAILAALVAHNPERARLRMGGHLAGVEEYLEQHPGH